MWPRWAFVSRTFAMTGVALFSSWEDEHPATSASAMAAKAALERTRLSSIGCAHQLRLVPPSAAQSLEQRRRVCETVRFCLDEAEARLLVCLVCVEHRQVGRIAVLVLETRQVEAGLRR